MIFLWRLLVSTEGLLLLLDIAFPQGLTVILFPRGKVQAVYLTTPSNPSPWICCIKCTSHICVEMCRRSVMLEPQCVMQSLTDKRSRPIVALKNINVKACGKVWIHSQSFLVGQASAHDRVEGLRNIVPTWRWIQLPGLTGCSNVSCIPLTNEPVALKHQCKLSKFFGRAATR
ncbi:hypothetical protein TNCV_974111 [Trichonephila clavipes]|nr:hypothetical protein TNCV_974111 [Trichonephila clavipes]